MFSEKRYELSLSINYVKDWGLQEAVRELIQNALDSNSPFEYEFIDDKLMLFSKYSQLSPSSLLLGCSSKDDKDTIGSFGEGYKIALLVLTRLGYPVVFYNNNVEWRPEFSESKQYQTKLLSIVENKAATKNEGLTVVIAGLSDSNKESIIDICLQLQNNIGAIKQTSYGDILLDKPGQLYVKGLFVCKTQLTYGYNVKPEYLQLERDRQTVSAFDLKWLTARMWSETDDLQKVAEYVDEGIADLEYLSSVSPMLVKEACYQHFVKKHPGKIPVQNQAELQMYLDRNMTNTVVINSSYYGCVKESNSYRTSSVAIVPKLPVELLEEYFSRNKQYMRRLAIVEFKAMLAKAKSWRG